MATPGCHHRPKGIDDRNECHTTKGTADVVGGLMGLWRGSATAKEKRMALAVLQCQVHARLSVGPVEVLLGIYVCCCC